MLSDLKAVEAVLARAACPEDVFGQLAGDKLAALRKAYHRIALIVHPDKYDGEAEAAALAAEVFGKLSDWRAKAESKINGKTYGDNKPHDPPPARPRMAPQVIQTPKRKYVVSSAERLSHSQPSVGIGPAPWRVQYDLRTPSRSARRLYPAEVRSFSAFSNVHVLQVVWGWKPHHSSRRTPCAPSKTTWPLPASSRARKVSSTMFARAAKSS
jgi:hypothetical protein